MITSKTMIEQIEKLTEKAVEALDNFIFELELTEQQRTKYIKQYLDYVYTLFSGGYVQDWSDLYNVVENWDGWDNEEDEEDWPW